MSQLEKEFKFYLENQKELAEKYLNRFIVIKDSKILGDYSSELEALNETLKNGEKIGTFLIQHCLLGTQGYSNTFHSRVSFK